MKTESHFDRTLAVWFDAEAPPTVPRGLVESVLAVTSESRPLPAWRAMLSTAPMRTPGHVLVGSPTLRLVRGLVLVLALASLVMAGGLVGAGAARLLDRDATIPDPTVISGDHALDFAATKLARWEPEPLGRPGDHYIARSPNRPFPDNFLGDLTIERPDYVLESWGRTPVAVPRNLVTWLRNHPSLDVITVSSTFLGGRKATAIDALPERRPGVSLDSLEAHWQRLLPALDLDNAWRYRFVLVDLGDGRWLVATCGAWPEQWSEAIPACEELLATWDWVGP